MQVPESMNFHKDHTYVINAKIKKQNITSIPKFYLYFLHKGTQ